MRPTFTSEYGGSFTLIEPGSLELSNRELTVTEPYFIGQRPVTQVEWVAIMEDNPSKFQDGWAAGLRPVERVSWLDCQNFINVLNDKETLERLGLVGRWRLPTADEWEYACRAGSVSRWFNSNADSDLDEVGWHAGNSGATTREVGQKKANDWGLYDTHGNVAEWCSDVAGKEGLKRVHKGGSWLMESESTTATASGVSSVDKKSDGIGLRLVWAPL